jgi:LysM repeat protein
MIGSAMVAKSARFAAPVALAAVAVATYLIVHGSLDAHHSSTTASSLLGNGHSVSDRQHRHRTPRFYVVKAGDTLSEISVKTHVSIVTITSLNPGLNPNALQTGQRLRLRR